MIFLNPQEVLNQLEIKEDMAVADFGCGSGGFTLPLARKVKKGFVYAIDVQELPLSALEGRAKIENINNIDFIHGDIEKRIEIPESSLDLVSIVNVLFQVEEKKSVIFEAKRLLKKNGRILIVDWDNEVKSSFVKDKASLKEIKEICKEGGFSLEKEFKAGAYHKAIVFSNN